MKEHIIYVRQRPHLQMFLKRVAEMFEIIVFTASQSIYAEKLLNILDPDSKLISGRFYRESCIFSNGNYVKDLTILGVDLAKVAIIDNSPQVSFSFYDLICIDGSMISKSLNRSFLKKIFLFIYQNQQRSAVR